MADHGTVEVMAVTDGIQPGVFGFNLQPLNFAFTANVAVPDTAGPASGIYNIAGTIQPTPVVPYIPPAIGQIWPRGDLDAIDAMDPYYP